MVSSERVMRSTSRELVADSLASPLSEKWPGQKCNRCKEEGLECSENLRANGHTRRLPDAPSSQPSGEREAILVERIRKLEATLAELRVQIETGPVRHTSSDGSSRETAGGHTDGHERNSPNSDDKSEEAAGWKAYYDLSLRVAWGQRVQRYMKSLASLGLDRSHNYYHLPLLPDDDREYKYDSITASIDEINNKSRDEKLMAETVAFRLFIAHPFPGDSLARSLTKLLLDINTNQEEDGGLDLSQLTVSSEILSSFSERNLNEHDLAMALGIQEAIVLKMLDRAVPPEERAIVRSAVSRYCQIHALCQDRLDEICEYPWHRMAFIPPLHMLLFLSRQQSLLHLVTESEVVRTDFLGRGLFHLVLDLKLDAVEEVTPLLRFPHLEDMTKRKPLHISPLNGQFATSLALIDLAARAGRLQDQDREGRTALHIASAKGHAALVLRLLERGAAVGGQDIRGRTPLYYAVAGGQASTTSILTKRTRWQDWSTLVLPAVERGNVAVVSMIMDMAAGRLSRDVTTEALEKAVLSGNENLLAFLMQALPDSDTCLNGRSYGEWEDETLVEVAFRTKNANVVELLISRYDAPIYWADLLPYALDQQGSEDVVHVLLESGKIDVNSRNSLGKTALHFAARVDWDHIVGIFLNLGADTEIRDSDGRTPLFKAVEGKSLKTAGMLLEGGAKVLVTDTEGKSPLDVCLEDKAPNMEIKDLLEKHMNKNVAITATQLV
ncbi:ankyrin repeat-containing domain protein [Rhypophila decipiens]|uniref:Ankyrin repeat-containing domain protein n=1 Tax=Rhypophila decipiens TaxID=261697 RepID=A0AAN7B2B0_9PEZI|nr:ankyrin repeat-containing domain protein [Rhypophila decipiens]